MDKITFLQWLQDDNDYRLFQNPTYLGCNSTVSLKETGNWSVGTAD